MSEIWNMRIQNKHDTEEHWETIKKSFVPLEGEIIIYDADGTYDRPRMKVGTGAVNLESLPFCIDQATPPTVELSSNARRIFLTIGGSDFPGDVCSIVPVNHFAKSCTFLTGMFPCGYTTTFDISPDPYLPNKKQIEVSAKKIGNASNPSKSVVASTTYTPTRVITDDVFKWELNTMRAVKSGIRFTGEVAVYWTGDDGAYRTEFKLDNTGLTAVDTHDSTSSAKYSDGKWQATGTSGKVPHKLAGGVWVTERSWTGNISDQLGFKGVLYIMLLASSYSNPRELSIDTCNITRKLKNSLEFVDGLETLFTSSMFTAEIVLPEYGNIEALLNVDMTSKTVDIRLSASELDKLCEYSNGAWKCLQGDDITKYLDINVRAKDGDRISQMMYKWILTNTDPT